MNDVTRLEDILVQHGMDEDAARRVSEEASGLDTISIIDELDSVSDDDIETAYEIIKDHDIYVSLDDFAEVKSAETKHNGIGENKMRYRKKVTEGVLGMSSVGTLGRLRKLAGIPIKEDDNLPEISDGEDIEDQGASAPTDDFSDDNYSADDQNSTDDFSDFNDNSDAMSTVQDAINNISTSLPDLKISEYKQVVDQLKNLLDSARSSGRSYIGEANARRLRNRFK